MKPHSANIYGNWKNEKTKYKIKWKILARSKPYNPITGVCNLCTLEKFYILFKSELGTLNKKEEIFNQCRHKRKLLLDNTWFLLGIEEEFIMDQIILVHFVLFVSLMSAGNTVWNNLQLTNKEWINSTKVY